MEGRRNVCLVERGKAAGRQMEKDYDGKSREREREREWGVGEGRVECGR